MNQIILDTPQEVIDEVAKINNIYIIKIKCLACSESKFINYENMIVSDLKVTIGEHSFPIAMIENVTVRYKTDEMKLESKYKVSAKYLKSLLNEEAKKLLLDFNLL